MGAHLQVTAVGEDAQLIQGHHDAVVPAVGCAVVLPVVLDVAPAVVFAVVLAVSFTVVLDVVPAQVTAVFLAVVFAVVLAVVLCVVLDVVTAIFLAAVFTVVIAVVFAVLLSQLFLQHRSLPLHIHNTYLTFYMIIILKCVCWFICILYSVVPKSSNGLLCLCLILFELIVALLLQTILKFLIINLINYILGRYDLPLKILMHGIRIRLQVINLLTRKLSLI